MKTITLYVGLLLFSILFIGLNDARSQNVCPEDGQVIAGQLDVNGPTQMGRIFRDAIPSSCPAKTYPGIFNPGTPYSFQVHEFAPANSTSCVTVNFNPGVCGTNAHASAYLNSYDPNNQAANYVGDVGSSIMDSFSFDVPAGDRLLVVVTNTAAAATCGYSFSIVNYPCVTSASISLEPETATLNSGEPHTVTATAILNGDPFAGVLVRFEVTSGPNAGRESQPGSGECSPNDDCTTDANGQVSWTYTGGANGVDTVTASFVIIDMTVLSDPVEVIWRGRPIPTLSEWGLIAMAVLSGIIGIAVLRRRKATA